MRRRVPTTVAALLLLVALPAVGQDNPDTGRGFKADKVYRFGQLDSVNLFNGNLTLVLPLGGSYPVDGALSYALTLTYNSNVWRFNNFQWWQPDGGIVTSRVASLERSNAGPGWRLTLGDLQEPSYPFNDGTQWVYIGQDGAEHAFYDTLHAGETATSGVFYSRDGSYLRLVRESLTAYRVEFPDGSRHRFVRDSFSSQSPLRLTSIEDVYGNRLSVSYPSALHWVLSDGHRSHDVYFRTLTNDGEPWTVVDRVELAAFGGARATYGFGYSHHFVEESGFDDFEENDDDRGAYLLSSVALPEGGAWRMSYYTQRSEGSGADLSASENQGGVLRELTLPTLGTYDWTYQDYRFPGRVLPGQPGGGTLSLATSTGVQRKRMRDAAGACVALGQNSSADHRVGCKWFYAWSQNLTEFERTTTVTTPNGDDTVHYFDVHPRPDPDTWEGWEYGLPFTKAVADGAGRFLSQQIYDGSAATGTLVREVYVDYGRDRISNVHPEPHYWENTNRRMRQRRVLFKDDGAHFRQRTWSDFDGLGHYRTQQVAASLPGGGTRTTDTGYNAGNGSYTVDLATNTATGGYQAWPTSSPWVLGTYDETRVSEGGDTAVAQFCFETATGFLLRRRVLEGMTPGSHDVLVVNTRSSVGNLTQQRFFGGDVQAVSTSPDLCSLTPPATDRYRQQHGYSFGARSSSSWRNADGTEFLEILNRTVDPDTGLPSRDTDVAGVHVDYDYDLQGRLTLETPQTGHGARTVYLYSEATSAANPARVEVHSTSNDGSIILARSEVVFDAFGRPRRDRRLGADGQWSSVDTVRDSMGRKRSVSERQTGVPNRLTVFKDYDPFGRPHRVEPPDTAAHRVLFFRTGERITQREVMVCALAAGCPSVGDETKHQITERSDRHGRLYQVVEPSGAGGANVTTTYAYDVGNRLRQATTSAAGVTQTRLFNYDHRGFLTSERHPEKGAGGNGFVTYSDYDPLGNPGGKVDGPFELRYQYDRAGRLIQVDEQTATGARPLKVFHFATANAGTDLRKGKLEWAERYNYVSLNDNPVTVRVRETYEYAGTGGAVSRRDTQLWVGGGAQESFTQGFAWTDLGDVALLDYPQCTNSACTLPAPHTVSFSYTNGFLTSVPGFGTVSYHANGMVHQVTHPNGVTDTVSLDGSGMARPGSIRTSGASTDWSSGTYRYDGSGNVTQIGASRFAYDGVSRLRDATVVLDQSDGCAGDLVLSNQTIFGTESYESCASLRAGPSFTVASTADVTMRAAERVVFTDGFSVQSGASFSAGTDATITGGGGVGESRTRGYSYDAFGNLTAISGDGGHSIPVDPATNRLSGLVSYDAAGNLTSWNGRTFSYDALGMMWGQARPDPGDPNGLEEWLYLYTADDERIWTFHPSGSDWTLRGLDGKVLRHYHAVSTAQGTDWSLVREYIYRGSQLLAGIELGVNTWHYSLDHLGTPRLITGNAANADAYHVYYPYGEEATDWDQDAERMKFTGHERDFTVASGPGDDLDYMHARFYGALTGRFMSPDKLLLLSKAIGRPQLWNHYSYVSANPLVRLDPTGNYIVVVGAETVKDADEEVEAVKGALIEAGATEIAEQIQAEIIGGEVRITAGGADLSDSSNSTVELIGSAIGKKSGRIALSITDDNLSRFGGAATKPFASPRSADPNQITIRLNPQQISQQIVPGTFTAGPLQGAEVGLLVSLGTALVHELGHARGYYEFNAPRFPAGTTNSDALYYENRHRELLTIPRFSQRTRH